MTDRSAHASIRGYLFQAWVTVRRWLDLRLDERLVCEGIEDVDVVAADGTLTFEQVKDLSNVLRLSNRSVKRCLSGYVDAFVAAAAEGRATRLVFTTTAAPEDGFEPEDCARTEARLRKVVGDGHPGIAVLDKCGHWDAFLGSLTWEFGAPDVDGQRRAIEGVLRGRFEGAPVGLAADRLLAAVFRASSQKEVGDRELTAAGLDRLLSVTADELLDWSARTGIGAVVRRLRTQDFEDVLARHLDPGEVEAPAGDKPSRLLNPRYAAVDFLGRKEELAVLASWLDRPNRTGTFLLLGSGGSGKTRLALEVCRRARNDGWVAGLLHSAVDVGDVSELFRGERDRLLVVDYAQGRKPIVRKLLLALSGHDRTAGPRVRVLLVAREMGDWWTALEDDTELEAVVAGAPIRTVREPRIGRTELFRGAARCFASCVGRREPRDVPDLNRKHFERLLYVHAAALVAVLGEFAGGPQELLDRILVHEANHWDRTHRATLTSPADQETANLLTRRLLAVATLVGGIESESEARALAPHLVGGAPEDRVVRQSVRVLCEHYSDPEGERVVAPLQPDLLGEHLVEVTFRQDAALLDHLFSEENKRWWKFSLVVLNRVAAQLGARPLEQSLLSTVIASRIGTLAATVVEVALENGDPIGKSVFRLVEGRRDVELARFLDGLVPAESVSLQDVNAWIFDVLLMEAPDPRSEDERAERARLLNNASVSYAGLGRTEEALEAVEEAVAIRRELAEARPDAYLPDLAGALNNQGIRLSDFGRREDALEAVDEAVTIFRALAEARPDAFLSDLAGSLSNQSNHLSDFGRRKEALEAVEEAVAIYRAQAKARPDAFLPNLATFLNNQSNRLSDLGRRKEALAAAEEAVAIRRAQAEARPDAFLPDLGGFLINLSSRLSDHGFRGEALAAIEEAVAIFRALAEARPDAFDPNFAMSLNNQSNCLLNLGRREDALAAVEEAVTIRRALAEARPDAFLPNLAMSLSNQSNCLSNLGRWEDALAPAEESVTVYRAQAKARPDAFLPNLATSLHNQSNCLLNLGRREDALAAVEEEVAIRRELAEARPDAFLPDLAMSLRQLGRCLVESNRDADAAESVREAIELVLPVARRYRTAFGQLVENLTRDYLVYCRSAGLEPEGDLLRFLKDVLSEDSP